MGVLTTTGKNTVLDSGLPDTLYAALHTGDPGTDGSANEITGGDPAYARLSVTMAAASAGARATSAAVTFDVPAGTTVAYASLWTALTGGSCISTDDVTSESFAAQGQYKLNSYTVTLSDS